MKGIAVDNGSRRVEAVLASPHIADDTILHAVRSITGLNRRAQHGLTLAD